MTLRFCLRLFLLLSLMAAQALAYPLAHQQGDVAAISDVDSYDDDVNALPPQEEETSVQPLDEQVEARPLQPTPQDAHQQLHQLQRQLQTLTEQTRAVQESLKNIQTQLQSQQKTTVEPQKEQMLAPLKAPKMTPALPSQKSPVKIKEEAVLLPGEDPIQAPLPTGSLPNGPAQEQYAYALSLLSKRDLIGAQQTFKAFITTRPDHPLVVNAKYYLADIAFQQEDYEAAAAAFSDAYEEILKQKKKGSSPQRASKASEILAKLACSLTQLGRSADACVILKQLKAEFPHLAANAKATAFKGMPLPKCDSKKH